MDIRGRLHAIAGPKSATRESAILAALAEDLQAYRQFLDIIVSRYVATSAQHLDSARSLFERLGKEAPAASLPGPSQEVYDHGVTGHLNTSIRLDIESFYIFAKILLDKCARFLEFCFGQSRRASLDSHDDLVKRFVAYCAQRDLVEFQTLLTTATELKTDIADFRDYQISHHKNPRTRRAVAFTLGAEFGPELALWPMYSTERDRTVKSKQLAALMVCMDAYLGQVLDFLAINRKKMKRGSAEVRA